MSKHIAFPRAALSAAAAGAALLAASVLPAAAADYFGGYDGGYAGGYGGGDRPLSYHSRDDVYIDGGRAHVEHRQDLRPAEGYRRGPGPVVFDERVPDHRYGGYGYDRPVGFIPHVGHPYGGEGPYGYGGFGGYRPAAVAVGPAYGGGYGGPGYGGPDEGCTVERARSYTPAGWEKTVTHRTCYRR